MDRNTKLVLASLSIVTTFCVYKTFRLTQGVNDLIDAVDVLMKLNDRFLTDAMFEVIIEDLDEDE